MDRFQKGDLVITEKANWNHVMRVAKVRRDGYDLSDKFTIGRVWFADHEVVPAPDGLQWGERWRG